jgi:addiction module HigA family antidote
VPIEKTKMVPLTLKKIVGKMYHPPHLGLTIKEDILPALGITVIEAANQLGVSRSLFSRVINGKEAISPDMALRIEKWLGVKNGGSKEVWLNQQARFNQWQTKRNGF